MSLIMLMYNRIQTYSYGARWISSGLDRASLFVCDVLIMLSLSLSQTLVHQVTLLYALLDVDRDHFLYFIVSLFFL
jgi:hypothetical protein